MFSGIISEGIGVREKAVEKTGKPFYMEEKRTIDNESKDFALVKSEKKENKQEKKQEKEQSYSGNRILETKMLPDASEEKRIEQNEKKADAYTICNYENCKRKAECRYYNAPYDVVNNDSQKLKKNFKNNRTAEWESYEKLHLKKLQESENGEWRTAAHHIISGNQVLRMHDKKETFRYGVIIKLANYFGYDINNEQNCIMLPTNEDGYGSMEKLYKTASAYDAMYLMGRQWHAGGHEYKLDKDMQKRLSQFRECQKYYLTSGSSLFCRDYVSELKNEMDEFLDTYRARKKCWEEHYEEYKEKFMKDMNGISRKVEKYLLEFEKNPQKSFPFFVSKLALEYAYALPKTAKIIIIYNCNSQIKAKKIRIEHNWKSNMAIIPKEKDDIEISDEKSFIRFCENVMYFFIEKNIDYQLPFRCGEELMPTLKQIDLGNGTAMDYVVTHGNEIWALISQNQYIYQPIAKVVLERGGR